MSLAANVAAAVTAAGEPGDENDKNIQQWKIKKLIKSLELARGNGTSMISLIIPPKDQISRVTKMLAEEYGTASNIKSRVNRQSVLGAITSTQQRLKLYNRVPNNGLVLYCGMIQTDDGKERKVNIDFEPFKPINTSLYLCVDGEAVVATSSGMGRRLEDVVSTMLPEFVYGSSHELANDEKNSLSVSQVTAFQRKGTRECVKVNIRGGRSLTCTPDHRVLVVRDGITQWIEAGELVNGDLAVCGFEAPVDDVEEQSWSLAGVGAISSNPRERARMLAFVRLCGLFVSGNNGGDKMIFSVKSELDVASVQNDIVSVCGSKGRVSFQEGRSVYEIAVPEALVSLFIAADVVVSSSSSFSSSSTVSSSSPSSSWPSWLLDENTPLCVVREFIGGVLGGDGGFAPSDRLILMRGDSIKMQQLCSLLARVGVNGALVTAEHIVCLPSKEASLAFAEKIGYRHSINKQARVSALSVYLRDDKNESFEAVMSEIGATEMFSNSSSCSLSSPALLLSVLDVCSVGERQVFDISVEALHSFTANSFAVHNCDNKFHTEPLGELLESDEKFGFIVMDGSGTLFGTLAGNTREVLHRMTVDLPKKHGRGGQSALRFARLRLEKRHNYVRKVAELAVQFFISNDRPNVSGLVLAGLADFKTELSASDMFDPRLQAIVLKVVDVSYGGDNGFNQAIELASEVLHNVKFIREKKLISQFFDEIAQDSGKYCFGVGDTLKALEIGAVESLLVYENLEIQRLVLKNNSSGEEKVVYYNKEQMANQNNFRDEASGADLETVDSMPMLEWLANNYKRFGAKLEIVTNRSQEGSQFVKGFGGLGGILRYMVEFNDFEDQGEAEETNIEDDFI